ncbi:MAG TPA: GNAT family N-acetyltransferase, partial [Candidatus Dormibacteraeota bacterium]|nr:GNAT family N-acetyltransferase [Candidatus Dormibacteraeota bacterium]
MARTGTTFQIRSVDAGELDSWLGLVNRARYWQDDRESLSFDDTLRPTGEPFLRVGAWTADGTLAGVGEARLSEDGSRFEDRAQGLVGVVPAFWRQGLGTRLADEVERFAVANGAKWVEAEVREDNLP